MGTGTTCHINDSVRVGCAVDVLFSRPNTKTRQLLRVSGARAYVAHITALLRIWIHGDQQALMGWIMHICTSQHLSADGAILRGIPMARFGHILFKPIIAVRAMIARRPRQGADEQQLGSFTDRAGFRTTLDAPSSRWPHGTTKGPCTIMDGS